MELRNKCSNGAIIFSSTLRSSSMFVPCNSRLARLFSSLPVCRTMRYKRSVMLLNDTMRTFIKPCCNSRLSRPCANITTAVSSRFFNIDCCTVCTSCTLSFMKRVDLLRVVLGQRDARLHLALCLNLHLTQLLAQTHHAGRQFQQTFL